MKILGRIHDWKMRDSEGDGLKQKWVFTCHSGHVLRAKCDVSYKVSTTSPATIIWKGERVLHSCSWSRFTVVIPCLSTGRGTGLAPDSSAVWKKCCLITQSGHARVWIDGHDSQFLSPRSNHRAMVPCKGQITPPVAGTLSDDQVLCFKIKQPEYGFST